MFIKLALPYSIVLVVLRWSMNGVDISSSHFTLYSLVEDCQDASNYIVHISVEPMNNQVGLSLWILPQYPGHFGWTYDMAEGPPPHPIIRHLHTLFPLRSSFPSTVHPYLISPPWSSTTPHCPHVLPREHLFDHSPIIHLLRVCKTTQSIPLLPVITHGWTFNRQANSRIYTAQPTALLILVCLS